MTRKKTSKSANPKKIKAVGKDVPTTLPPGMPKLPPEMEKKLKSLKLKLDKFKDQVLEKFGDYIVGITLLPPEKPMPTISEFFGIIISMYWDEHNPPHFIRAIYNKKGEARVDLYMPPLGVSWNKTKIEPIEHYVTVEEQKEIIESIKENAKTRTYQYNSKSTVAKNNKRVHTTHSNLGDGDTDAASGEGGMTVIPSFKDLEKEFLEKNPRLPRNLFNIISDEDYREWIQLGLLPKKYENLVDDLDCMTPCLSIRR